MSLFHDDFSGFFPFWIVPFDKENAFYPIGEVGVNDPSPLFQTALANLTQLYWLAKRVTISVNAAFNYSYVYGPPGAGTAYTNNGTVIGSADYSLSTPPGSRAGNSFQIGPSSSVVISGVDSVNGPYTDDAENNYLGFGIFVPMYYLPGARAAYDPVAKAYYARGGGGVSALDDVDPQPSQFLGNFSTSPPLGGGGATPISTSMISLRMNGVEIVPRSTFPVYPDPSSPGFSVDGSTYSLTGDMIVDFNEFWTP